MFPPILDLPPNLEEIRGLLSQVNSAFTRTRGCQRATSILHTATLAADPIWNEIMAVWASDFDFEKLDPDQVNDFANQLTRALLDHAMVEGCYKGFSGPFCTDCPRRKAH